MENIKSVYDIWGADAGQGDFVSVLPSYTSGAYFDKFDYYTYPCKEKGDIGYYLYDPVKHGASKDEVYPVLMWLHGRGSSFVGEQCISQSGGELFASEAYQRAMGGGAYIIIPLANEKKSESGEPVDYWDDSYIAPVKGIYDLVVETHLQTISKLFVMGGSQGGILTWRLLESFPDYFDGGIVISAGYVPADEALDKITESGIRLIVAHGRHDEIFEFNDILAPRLAKLQNMENAMCYFPEWVRNGDKGIASINYGTEMGQHCLINQFQANLIFDTGEPYIKELPEGVTGWIRKQIL